MIEQIEGINIAVEGCFHGNFDEIFGTIREIEKQKKIKIDLLLVCGDVQTHRNKHDMFNMACPIKYLSMGTFYKYYQGKEAAPCLTIFIGGNHEASNYLREMYFGGWVAPNIYYLGDSNIIQIKKGNTTFKLGGTSGIFKIFDFNNPKLESFPFKSEQLRSVYHTKQVDLFKLSLYEGEVNMFLSHDWPQQIHQHGSTKELLKKKQNFEADIKSGRLGSQPHKFTLERLQPDFWFAAHMHVKFEALVKHKSGKQTKFLALDKCIAGRDFLQVFTYTKDKQDLYEQFAYNDEPIELFYDSEWLSIVHTTYKLLTIWDKIPKLFEYNPALKELQIMKKDKYQEFLNEKHQRMKIFGNHKIKIPNNFEITSPPYDEQDNTIKSLVPPNRVPLNNQMKSYLNLFNESGQELNGLIFYEPDQPRIIGEFVTPDFLQKQIELENQKEILQQKDLQQQEQQEEPSSPKDDELNIQDFPFLQ
ncbi:unnamed protein product [Paramecium pentaurelia]|uniref:Lariat debranching enzyme C-terminal domain-containing protein n=1 Tax=Paramecium pentaurelia TaxID=43138 RepID=A0A8S1TPW7_9CILI|nr:unnamed protein product [Paramecium pentaurelia]